MSIRYGVHVSYVPARGRHRQDRMFRGEAAVDVREASKPEAPVAVALTGRHPSVAEERVEYRWFDGRLWRSTDTGLEGAFARWRTNDADLQPVESLDRLAYWREGIRFSENVPDALRTRAARLLLVDGVLHEDKGEPYWGTERHAGSSSQLSVWHACPGEEGPAGTNVARLDDAEGRERIARNASGGDPARLVRLHDVEVPIPGALRVDPVANAVEQAARKALEALERLLRPEDLAEGMRRLAAGIAPAGRAGTTAEKPDA